MKRAPRGRKPQCLTQCLVLCLAATISASCSTMPRAATPAQQAALASVEASTQFPQIVPESPASQARFQKVGDWLVDLNGLETAWGGSEPLARLEQAFELTLNVGDDLVTVPTHLFAGDLVVVPYSDQDAVSDALGQPVDRGDTVLAGILGRGSLAFAVKSHRSSRRRLSERGFSAAAREEIGLADNHLSMVVGIERKGRPGIATVSMPQSYAQGRIGSIDSPPIFLTPKWPALLTQDQIDALETNIRTYLVGFHAVGHFSFRYLHGDQLAAHDPDSLTAHAAQMVRAIGGDRAARDWFKAAENQFYCSELAYVALSAGLRLPLNDVTMVPLVGVEAWQNFQTQIALHRKGEGSAFSELSRNQLIADIDLALAPEHLRPVDLTPDGQRHGMVFSPMSAIDIIDLFLRHTVPRESMGEAKGARFQVAILGAIRSDLFSLLRASKSWRSDDAERQGRELFERLEQIVGVPHENYAAFRAAIEIELRQASDLLIETNEDGVGLFALPALFHLVAEGYWPQGSIGLQYLGHGLEWPYVAQPTKDDP